MKHPRHRHAGAGMNKLKIGSLFSGYGGLDMAVESVTGARTAWVSDIDKGACKILAHRYPDVPNHGDLTAIDWTTVEPVDIITGGFPCQDLSTAGKRAGMAEGTRSGLWSYMCDAINIIRPRLVVAENVRGLLSAEALSDVEPCPWCVGDGSAVDLRALGRVLADLADIGYDASWYGLRAADVGACHGRWRCFVVAYPNGKVGGRKQSGLISSRPPSGTATKAGQRSTGRGGRTHLEAGVGLLPTPRASRGASTTETFSLLPSPRATDGTKGGPNQRGSSGDLMLPSAVTHLLPTPAVNDMGAGKEVADWDAWTDKMKAAHGNGNGHGASLSIEALRLLPTPTVQDSANDGGPSQFDRNTPPLNTMVKLLPRTSVADVQGGRKSRSGARNDELLLNGLAAGELFGQYADAVARWETVTGRPAPSPTEPTGKNGAARLSPRFTEWMMGLPDGWITDVPGITRNEGLKACGNGVVPQQAAAALRLLLPTLEVAV